MDGARAMGLCRTADPKGTGPNKTWGVLGARYVFNSWEKVLFAKGTLPVLLRHHRYADAQDEITYAEWHRRRGMSEHMLRTFFGPMALALNFTSVDDISAEAMLRVMAYFASSRDASRAGFFDGPPGPRFVEPLAAHVRERGARLIHLRQGARHRQHGIGRNARRIFPGEHLLVRDDAGKTLEQIFR